ncbi:hypothetical protein [Flavobacterium gelatinilyticum]|uniref:hypothetical protein n=1 Tax=Flavobacterium gelatinilyticum TaxID=3003260 RepID=UPI0024815AF7|nr:hypothetical protein [Flavobacterium gelatinilyticum]
MKIKLLVLTLLFLVKFGFAQNYVTYTSLNNTLNINSGVEGTVDVLVNCYGGSSDPVFLNALQSCGNNDGITSQSYTNGSILTPGQNTTIRYKFKKTVAADTQIIYKFSTNGSCFQEESKMIKITVNYKAVVVPPPTPISNNNIYGTQTIVEGASASTITGSSPSGGNGSFSYIWQKKIGTGAWTTISGATGINYSPGSLTATSSFRRIVSSSTLSSTSNEVVVTVNAAPPLQNNIITQSGSQLQGSQPSGGTGTYVYYWYAYVLQDEDPWLIGQSINCTIPQSVYNFVDGVGYNGYITRVVVSGTQQLYSNYIIIPPSQPLTNNTITQLGSELQGSQPSGGTGTYVYYWYAYVLQDEDPWLIGQSINCTIPQSVYNFVNGVGYDGYITRVVVSGNKQSYSNYIVISPGSGFAKSVSSTKSSSLDVTVYPNPTSESLNFATNFAEDKNIEIVLYSEKLGNEKSVYKGKVAPNQVVNWSIPAGYQKGLYFYKILSDNKEVKTGKVIFQ